MIDIVIFQNKSIGEINVLEVDNKLFYFAKNIAEGLEFENPNEAIEKCINSKYITTICLTDLKDNTFLGYAVDKVGVCGFIFDNPSLSESKRLKMAKDFGDWELYTVKPYFNNIKKVNHGK